MKKGFRFAVLILLFGALSTAAVASPRPVHRSPNSPAPVHNGLWWQEKSGLFKEAFLGGYKAGAEHAAGHALDVNKFPASELQDGLDAFYKDFRNRSILVDDALNYVEEQLRGTPDDKLAAQLQHLRQAAAPASDQ